MGVSMNTNTASCGMMTVYGTLLSTVSILTLIVSMAGASSWNYGVKSPGDPEHWGSIKGSEKCGTGRRQSPVDISSYRTKQLPDLEFHNYDDLFNDVELVNNGHSPQLNKKHKKHQISISGGGLDGRYYFEQLHFHWGDNSAIGSEHTIHGRRFPLEMHLVHFSSEYSSAKEASTKPGGLVVLSVLFQIAEDDNIFLRPITEASRRAKTESSSTKHVAKLSLDTLLPRNRRSFYRYEGSLTTPPCSETVSWFLFYDQPTVSEAQMQLFRLLTTAEPSIISGELADNFRPLQELHGRHIYFKPYSGSGDDVSDEDTERSCTKVEIREVFDNGVIVSLEESIITVPCPGDDVEDSEEESSEENS